MGKALRLLSAVAVAAATVPFFGVGPAVADDTSLSPSTGAYFYSGAIRKPDESPAAPPNLTSDHTDGVAKGNLAVAAQGGQEDKVSFLLFDLLDVSPGSVVTKATLTLPLVENNPPDNVSYGEAPAKVRACGAGDEGFNGDDGTAIQDAPKRLCDVFSAPAKASTDGKAYVIDITKLAQTWVDASNDGVALTAAEGAATTPFQVVFAPAEKATLALTFTPGADDLALPTVPSVGSGTTTPPDLGMSGGTLAPPPADAGFGAVSPPVVPDAPAPAAGIPPQAAPAAAAPQALQPVSLETLRPTTAFWLGGIVLAALLVLLSLIMGDSSVPQATTKPSRLARALADRQRGVGPARPALGRAATV